MEQARHKFLNTQAQDQEIAGVYEDIDSNLINLLKSGNLTPKHLMVCGGSTSSRCAAKGHWTLDLRKNYAHMSFNKLRNEVTIGAGISMGNLINYLSKFNRSFPIGISGDTGIGYILTGGISPLSRKYGLAIDQIEEIKGYWANGTKFRLTRPDIHAEANRILTWKALCGAAPFLAIVTSLRLKTYNLNPIKVWQSSVSTKELAEITEIAEELPDSASLYWIWGDRIKVYGVYESINDYESQHLEDIICKFKKIIDFSIESVESINKLPNLICPIDNIKAYSKQHSEVIGLLGPSLKGKSHELVIQIEQLMRKRPNKYSFIASQQLGGASKSNSRNFSSFIHRDAIWKPWITGSWEAGNEKERQEALLWMEDAWMTLRTFYPGIHLAQIHPHLTWHKEEINFAFKSWLPKLKELKSNYDPKGILPPL